MDLIFILFLAILQKLGLEQISQLISKKEKTTHRVVKSHFKGVDKTRQKLHNKHHVRIYIMEKLIAILLTTLDGQRRGNGK